jgi:flagellar biosynthesis/type III secretory pathway protein FliH
MGEFRRFRPAQNDAAFQARSFAKSDDSSSSGQSFTAKSFHARQKAPEVVEEPEQEEPELDIDALRQEAYDLGVQDVREELEPQIRQLEEQLSIVQPLIHQLLTMRREAVEMAAKDVAAIVLQVSRRVVGDSLAYNPEALPVLVENAISQMPEEDQITIKVAPDDVECIQDAVGEAYKDRVQASNEIEAGCLVETQFASIDSSLEAVLAGLETAVNEWLDTQHA